MSALTMPSWSARPWVKVLLWILAILLLLVLIVAFFPWDVLRGPINRFVTEKTGREFAITRHLDVKLGRTTRVLMDGIEFANPDWAQDRYLVRAQAAEVHVRLLPLLFHREFELPLVRLTQPELGLQAEPDGRRTWALGGDTKKERNIPTIGAFVVDRGTVHYVAREQGADVRARFAIDGTQGGGDGPPMPLRFDADGRWQGQAFTAQGRTGDVLYLSAPLQKPFPAEVALKSGATALQARGALASLATLDGANVDFRLQGQNLAHLYKLVGVVLPDTKPYSVAGQLSKGGETWTVKQMQGRLGRSDIAGDLAFRKTSDKPFLSGNLRSRMLDFEDLGPVIGLDKPDPRRVARPQPERPQIAAAEPQNSAGAGRKAKAPKDPNRKVLPNAPLDVSRLNSMNADVQIDAAKVVNAKGLPLDSMKSHVVLRDGRLVLDPLSMGVAGGRVAGLLRIDATAKPAVAQARLDGTGLELNKLVPTSQTLKNAFGKLQAQIDLTARGASTAQMLATANGNVALLMGKGEISNLALEIAGLDGGEIIKFFTEGDRRVAVRCGVAAFDVANGLMTSRAVVFDTNDTVFFGRAKVNFANEAMDIYVKPQPKDRSILSLRSPLQLGGTFGAPQVGLDKGALARRGAAALALGAINPLLALAATVETGPGHDIDCKGILDKSAAPRAEARVDKTPAPLSGPGGKPVGDPAKQMGAGPAPKRAPPQPAR